MAIVGTDPVARCTPEEWKEFLGMVRHGMLLEVIEWLDAGKPSLRPERKFISAFESAILHYTDHRPDDIRLLPQTPPRKA